MKKHSKLTPVIYINIADADDPKKPYKVVDHKGKDDRVERVSADKSFFPDVTWVIANRTKGATFEKVKLDFRSKRPVNFGVGDPVVQNLAPGDVDDLDGRVVGHPDLYEYDIVIQDGKGQYILDPELQIDDRGKRANITAAVAFVAGVVVGVVAGGILL